MIRLMRWLLGLCEHKFRTTHTGVTHVTGDFGRWDERYFIRVCDKCGCVKKAKVKM